MRAFEIILLLVVSILPFVQRPLGKRVRPTYLVLILGILALLHIIVEGWRWQMIPAYILVLVVAWKLKRMDLSKPARLSFFRMAGFLAIAFIAIVGWVLPMALPVFTLPEPGGPYSVGTEMIHVQTDKEERISKDPDDRRELMIKVWYPSEADVSSVKGDTYVNDASRAGFATKYGLPPSALNYLDLVDTYAFPGIPVADGSFPVLIFSHGYGSKATGYYALLTELASRGYIIINMNHTFESLGVTFPDGRTSYFDYAFQGEISSGSMEAVNPLIEAFKNGASYEERHPIVRTTLKDYFEASIQDRWADDIIYTMDLLDTWHASGPLQDKLDLDRIGIVGHSVGGGTAGNVAMKDPRIKAAANLDGIQWGTMIDSTYHIPYLYVSADWPAEHEDINSHVFINKSTDYFYETKVLNSGHPNFMDIPFMIPVKSLAGTGDIDPYLGMEIVTNLVTAFFDRHLKDLPDADPQRLGDHYELLEMTVYRGNSTE